MMQVTVTFIPCDKLIRFADKSKVDPSAKTTLAFAGHRYALTFVDNKFKVERLYTGVAAKSAFVRSLCAVGDFFSRWASGGTPAMGCYTRAKFLTHAINALMNTKPDGSMARNPHQRLALSGHGRFSIQALSEQESLPRPPAFNPNAQPESAWQGPHQPLLNSAHSAYGALPPPYENSSNPATMGARGYFADPGFHRSGHYHHRSGHYHHRWAAPAATGALAHQTRPAEALFDPNDAIPASAGFSAATSSDEDCDLPGLDLLCAIAEGLDEFLDET